MTKYVKVQGNIGESKNTLIPEKVKNPLHSLAVSFNTNYNYLDKMRVSDH
jgi:hypothetical protein